MPHPSPQPGGPQLAKRLREVLLNGDWIARTNFQDQLAGLDWQDAAAQYGSLNSIAALTFHVHYYLAGVLRVLQGGALDIHDKYSYDMPPLRSQEDWHALRQKLLRDAETFALAVERLTETQLDAVFVKEAYGDYRRNIEGIIEHSYYHLGQLVLVKKLLAERPLGNAF